MSDLHSIFDNLEKKFSSVVEYDPFKDSDAYKRIEHLLESDKELYQYLLIKDSRDVTNIRLIVKELTTALRTGFDHTNRLQEDIDNVKTTVDRIDSKMKKIDKLFYIHLVYAGLFLFTVLFVLAAIHPSAFKLVTEFVKNISIFR